MKHHAPLTLALVSLLAGPATAKTLKVGPGDSIQAALDAASPGDKVVVTGVHREHVSINTSGITLIGKGATIDGQYVAYGIAAWVPDVTVKGFRVIHGAPGIRVFADRVTVTKCVMQACTEFSLDADGDDLVLTKNTIETGAGVRVTSATSASDTRFDGNTLNDCGPATLSGGRFSVEKNTLDGADGIAVTADHGALASTIVKNVLDRAGPLAVTATGGTTVVVEKNTATDSREDGLVVTTADGASVELRKNVVVRCASDGFDVQHESTGTVTSVRNRVLGGSDDGFEFTVTGAGTLTSTDDEVDGCEADGIDVLLEDGSFGSVLIEGADVRDAVDNGLELDNFAGSSYTVRDSAVRRCIGDGVNADGIGFSLLDLDVRSCNDDGIDADGDFITIARATIEACGARGIWLGDGDIGGSTISDCVVSKCARDGMYVASDSTEVVDNELRENSGDGIEVATGSGVVLDGNACHDNGHEGIDNNGTTTTIRDNVLSGNGGVLGPDLAGAGDGTGTVSGTSTGNQFGTGGLAEVQRLDL